MKVKKVKTEIKHLPDDVWTLIVEFTDNNDLINILVLSERIHNLANSEFSWSRRLKREFPQDMMDKVKCFGISGQKSTYKTLRKKFKTIGGVQGICGYREKKYFSYREDRDPTTGFNDVVHFAIFKPQYSFHTEEVSSVRNTEVHWNRAISTKLAEYWFPQGVKPSVNFIFTSAKLQSIEGEEDICHVKIRVRLARFEFLAGVGSTSGFMFETDRLYSQSGVCVAELVDMSTERKCVVYHSNAVSHSYSDYDFDDEDQDFGRENFSIGREIWSQDIGRTRLKQTLLSENKLYSSVDDIFKREGGSIEPEKEPSDGEGKTTFKQQAKKPRNYNFKILF